MSLNCNAYEPQLRPDNKIGVCTGTCEDDADCLSHCKSSCYWVDLNWQPNLQDYATYVLWCGERLNIYTHPEQAHKT